VDEAVRTLAIESGGLRRVAGVQSSAGYAFLDLIFDRGTLHLACDADSDEIVVSANSDHLLSGVGRIARASRRRARRIAFSRPAFLLI